MIIVLKVAIEMLGAHHLVMREAGSEESFLIREGGVASAVKRVVLEDDAHACLTLCLWYLLFP